MNESSLAFLAVQNGVILDVYPTREQALQRVHDEMKRDFLSIVLRKKLRKLFKKSGNVALHQYSVIESHSMEVVKE